MTHDAHSRALPLTPDEWESLDSVIQDPALSNTCRARAHALLLLRDRVDEAVIASRTGLNAKAQRRLVRSLQAGGLSDALASKAKRSRTSKFPIADIVRVLGAAIKSRPPEGSTRWDLRKLTLRVREQVSGADSISSETVRTLLRKHLGVRSVRQIEPFWLQQVRHHKENHTPT